MTPSIDGKLIYASSGDVIDIASHKIIAQMKDEYGRVMHSEKLLDMIFTKGRLTPGIEPVRQRFRLARGNHHRFAMISSRRYFLSACGGAAMAVSRLGAAPSQTKLAGVFPIAFSPFTEDNKLDLDGLASEVRFCNRGGVHGLVWPQIGERLDHPERYRNGWTARRRYSRRAKTQRKGGKTATRDRRAGAGHVVDRRAMRNSRRGTGADAIISLPPPGMTNEKALLGLLPAGGPPDRLPLFAQTSGTISVDLLVEMFRTISTFRYVKEKRAIPCLRDFRNPAAAPTTKSASSRAWAFRP